MNSRNAKISFPTACSSRRSWRNIISDAWTEIVERCQDAGVDSFELNFSCPHGLPERKMGAAMGENPEILEEVVGWVMKAAQETGVGEDDAERHAHHRSEPRGVSRRLPGRERDQHDSQRHGGEPRHAAPGADRGRIHDAGRLFVQGGAADRAAHGDGNRDHDSARISRTTVSPVSAESRAATMPRSSFCSAPTPRRFAPAS